MVRLIIVQLVWELECAKQCLRSLLQKLSSTLSLVPSPLSLNLQPNSPSGVYRTKLIDDAKSPNPKYRGLIHGTIEIVKSEGISGIYRGLGPVAARQGANSAVRFTTYGTLKVKSKTFSLFWSVGGETDKGWVCEGDRALLVGILDLESHCLLESLSESELLQGS